jgi:hypothetical protein
MLAKKYSRPRLKADKFNTLVYKGVRIRITRDGKDVDITACGEVAGLTGGAVISRNGAAADIREYANTKGMSPNDVFQYGPRQGQGGSSPLFGPARLVAKLISAYDPGLAEAILEESKKAKESEKARRRMTNVQPATPLRDAVDADVSLWQEVLELIEARTGIKMPNAPTMEDLPRTEDANGNVLPDSWPGDPLTMTDDGQRRYLKGITGWSGNRWNVSFQDIYREGYHRYEDKYGFGVDATFESFARAGYGASKIDMFIALGRMPELCMIFKEMLADGKYRPLLTTRPQSKYRRADLVPIGAKVLTVLDTAEITPAQTFPGTGVSVDGRRSKSAVRRVEQMADTSADNVARRMKPVKSEFDIIVDAVVPRMDEAAKVDIPAAMDLPAADSSAQPEYVRAMESKLVVEAAEVPAPVDNNSAWRMQQEVGGK